MRRTFEECKVNIAYRWFLGLSMYDDIPNYSTWSKNYIRRYKDSEVFNEIFEKILNQAIEYKFIDMESVFGDCKEQMGLRYTRYRGLQKNDQYSTLIFACYNLKKMALWRSKNIKDNENKDKKSEFYYFFHIFQIFSNKKRYVHFKHTTLSTV